METLDIPTVPEFLGLVTAGVGEIYACKLAMEMFKLKQEHFVGQVKDTLIVDDFYVICGGLGTDNFCLRALIRKFFYLKK